MFPLETEENAVDLTNRPVMRFFPCPASANAQLSKPLPAHTSDTAREDVPAGDDGRPAGEDPRSERRCEGRLAERCRRRKVSRGSKTYNDASGDSLSKGCSSGLEHQQEKGDC